jgi:hypothetical protein
LKILRKLQFPLPKIDLTASHFPPDSKCRWLNKIVPFEGAAREFLIAASIAAGGSGVG